MATDLERWTERMAAITAAEPERAKKELGLETDALRDELKKSAPKKRGRLEKSIRSKGLSVVTRSRYAIMQDQGGRIDPKRRAWLTIPVKKGYRPGPKYFTITGRDGNQYVLRRGSRELWAIRRRFVMIPATHFLQHGLDKHLAQTDERLAKRAEDRLSEAGR